MSGRRQLSNWIAGLVVGVGAGVLSLILPVLGWLIVLAFLVGLLRASPRLPAFGGLLVGLGATWLVLLVRSHLDCLAFDALPGQECFEPDIGPFLTVGAAMLAIGTLATVLSVIVANRRASRGFG